MHFQMPLAAMKQFLERTNVGQKREDRFNQSTLIPGALLAQFEVFGHAILATKAQVTQRDRLPFVLLDEWQKTVIAFVGCSLLPIHYTPVLIDDPAQFDPYDPAPIAFALATDLLRRTAFAHRMKQFNAIAIGRSEKGRRAQKAIRPIPMHRQQTLQTRAFGEARKDVTKFAFEPAMEAVINRAKERCNNVFGFHESLQENGFGQLLFLGKALVKPMSRTPLFIFHHLPISTIR